MEFDGLEYICTGKNNDVHIDADSTFNRSKLFISGNNNKITLEKCLSYNNLKINIKGDNKVITIKRSDKNINGLSIISIREENQKVLIGENFSCGGLEIQMNDGNEICEIGKNCLFSWGIKLRTSDGHSIYDLETQKPINYPEDIQIGDRVWICEDVKILKGVSIPKETVIASGSIVTKKFTETNTVLAGVPAKVSRKKISWDYPPPKEKNIKNIKNIKNNVIESSKDFEKNHIFNILSLEQDKKITKKAIHLDNDIIHKKHSFSEHYTPKKIEIIKIKKAKLIGNEFYCSTQDHNLKEKKFFYLTSEDAVLKSQNNDIINGESSTIYLCCANSGYKNFYHWMFQCLLSVALYKRLFQGLNIKFVTPPLNKLRRDSLRLLGIEPKDYIELKDNETLFCDSLIYTNILSGEFSFSPAPLLESLYKELKPSNLIELPNYSRIYISRRDSPRRAIENDNEISEYLTTLGFKTVVMSEFTLEEQISIFSKAECIIAPHGAGLVNLLATENCKKILEIMPDNYFNDCFFRISQLKNIDYYNVVTNTIESSKSYHNTKSLLNIEKLKLSLRIMGII